MYNIKYFKRLRLNLVFFILLFLILFLALNFSLFGGVNGITLSGLNAKDIIVLTGRKGYDDYDQQLGKYLGNIGTAKCLERKNRIDAVKTPAQFEEFRKERLASFLTGIGPFPERTPLNVKHYGRVDCGDYVIEKLTYESRPGYIVTANLYIPTHRTPPYPIVLCPIGHWEANRGKDYFLVQERGIGLARRGYLTMIFEPFGQGERRIYYDPSLELKGKLGYATNQHAYLNYQLHLTGHNMANFFAWDGIRALDYLCSREMMSMLTELL